MLHGGPGLLWVCADGVERRVVMKQLAALIGAPASCGGSFVYAKQKAIHAWLCSGVFGRAQVFVVFCVLVWSLEIWHCDFRYEFGLMCFGE